MDVYCGKCGEPYDTYSVRLELGDDHPSHSNVLAAKDFKAGKGCPCCKWGATAPKERPAIAELSQVAMDLSGEDLDGAACDLEDLGMLGGRK